MKNTTWSLPTKWLHLGLVLTVTLQLLISLVMVAPDHQGGQWGKMAFELHEIVGLTALGIVVLHWIWSIMEHVKGGGLGHLFPWRADARQQVINELKGLRHGKLPAGGKRGGLSGFIHGLGLLVVTAIAITGGFLFILFPETGEPGVLAEGFAELHEALASLVWAYWLGHGGMAMLHHFSGHDEVKNMFTFNKSKKSSNSKQINDEKLTNLV